jgi:leucine dehydrogenase
MVSASIEDLLRAWDGEDVVVRFDRPTGNCILIAIYSTHLGPAGGGTRMKSYPDPAAALRDAMRLSEGMAYKFAVSDMPRGGGKAVIAVPPDLDPAARPDLLRRYGALVAQLGGLFQTGPDIGTTPEDMDVIAETGAPYVFCRTEAAGGSGDSAPASAVGVLAGIRVTCERLYGDAALAGRRVLVQGAGSVGRRLLPLLLDAGAVVLFSDVDEATIRGTRAGYDIPFIAPDEVYDTPCDIFTPCALGAILNAETIPRLACRAVAGSANNQLATSEDAESLRRRNILYAPDFVVNFGGAMAALGIELMGWPRPEAEARIIRSIEDALRRVFALADAEAITTEAARRIADERLLASPDAAATQAPWRPSV